MNVITKFCGSFAQLEGLMLFATSPTAATTRPRPDMVILLQRTSDLCRISSNTLRVTSESSAGTGHCPHGSCIDGVGRMRGHGCASGPEILGRKKRWTGGEGCFCAEPRTRARPGNQDVSRTGFGHWGPSDGNELYRAPPFHGTASGATTIAGNPSGR